MLGFVSSQKSQGTYNYLFADGNRGSVGQVTKLGDTHIRARGIRGGRGKRIRSVRSSLTT